MKRAFRVSYLIIFFLLFNNTFSYSQSNWVWQNPLPHGNFVYKIGFMNKYTGWSFSNFGYSFKSTNSGKNWTSFSLPNNPTITAFSFYKFDSVNYTGWLGGKSGALFKTTNSGATWISKTITPTNTVTDIYFKNQYTGYLSDGNLYKTTDGGNNWVNIPTGLNNNPVNYVYFLNDTVGFYGGLYVAGSGQPPYPPSSYLKINKTTNGGNNWININLTEFSYSTQSLNGIYFKDLMNGIAWGSFGLRRTTNGGYNWAYASDLKYFDIKSWNLIYGTGNNKIQKSTDFGYNWTVLDSVNTQTITQSAIFVPDSIIFNIGGTNGNITTSTDCGVSWTNSQTKITNKSINSIIALDSLNLYSISNGNNVLKTTNGGNNWQIYDSVNLNQSKPYTVFFLNSNTGWIGSTQGKVFKTVNGGNSWTLSNTGYNTKIIYLNFFINGVGFAEDSLNRIFKSSNWGIDWEYKGTCGSSIIQFVNPETGYSLSSDLGNTLKKTTNSGESWETISTLATYNYFRSFKYLNNNIVFAPGTYSYYGGGTYNLFYNFMLYSSNGGLNWIHLPGYYDVPIINNFHAVDSNIIYFYNQNYCLFQTTNRGNNWIISNFADPKINTITSFKKNLWVAGDYGMILKGVNMVPINVKSISSEIPNKIYLSQNYPNPFNPSTNIKYQITNNEFVSLKVFDILGKEIETLVNEKQSAGTYEVTFDASTHPSGVYFYRLVTDGFTDTKKMILLK